ncbi:hypothetical protein ACFQXB_15110 [Plastorhodobacter daqingensis]|uniref:Uncharacterized protein n=1 Tax=Plastorhodobacter daqingensis TaxID=1387281 RepID=A0ABW2UPQ4_9RHOB
MADLLQACRKIKVTRLFFILPTATTIPGANGSSRRHSSSAAATRPGSGRQDPPALSDHGAGRFRDPRADSDA